MAPTGILQQKHIILGVTGGIAAYKTATICSRLVQASAIVDVVMTEAAQKFITPLTFQALTHRPVYTDMFDIPAGENIPHIALADAADLLLIAPATAQTISKLAHGLADNLLTAIALATPAPMLLAPAMESDMWSHPATQANLEKLRSWGALTVGPAEGRLASGALGAGRSRIARHFAAETVLLGLAGGAAGIGLAVVALHVLLSAAPAALPRTSEIGLSLPVLAGTLAIALGAGLLFGLIPVAGRERRNLASALREGGRSRTSGKSTSRTRSGLASLQVALALVLLLGSALMLRSFLALRSVDPGFERPEEVLTFRLTIPPADVPGESVNNLAGSEPSAFMM